MRRLLLIFLSVGLLAFSADAPPTDGVFVLHMKIGDNIAYCTMFNYARNDEWVFALTAEHCLLAMKSPQVIDVQTKEVIASNIHWFCDVDDLAIIGYKTERTVALVPTTVEIPPRNGHVWKIGVRKVTEKNWAYLISDGLWMNLPSLENKKTFLIKMYVAKGESGSPIFFGKKAFAIAVAGASPFQPGEYEWTAVIPLYNLKDGCPKGE